MMARSYRITVTEEEFSAILSAAAKHDAAYDPYIHSSGLFAMEAKALERVIAKIQHQRERP